jgi:hypothetical protein
MKLKLLLFLIFFPAAVFGQMLNKPGELALRNGDILTGYITYFYDKPLEIIFSSENGTKQVYAAEQVRNIKLENGERFESKKYHAKGDSSYVVLKVLIESPKISLFVREDDATEYFYASKDDALYRLENNKIYENKGGKRYVREDKQYVAILGAFMRDRIDLVQDLPKVKLKAHSLAKVISEYNQGEETNHLMTGNIGKKEPNWVFFTQYSKFATPKDIPASMNAFGNMVGVQYYFSKDSRHSLKASVDYLFTSINNESGELYGLGLRYEWAFKRAEKYNIYFQVPIGELGYAVYNTNNSEWNKDGFAAYLRLHPGIGLELRPLPRMAVYGEINQLFNFANLPRSFTFGLKYDFGKTSWRAY